MRRLVTFLPLIALLAASAVLVAAQPSTATEGSTTAVRSDILPDVNLTVEEVEPGVYRVINDGVRDLDVVPNDLELPALRHQIVAGDGVVWLIADDQTIRLGVEGSAAFEFGNPHYPFTYIDGEVVAADGTLWVGRDALWSYEGESWSKRLKRAPRGLYAAPDGTVWVTWLAKGGPRLARFDADGHEVIGMPKATITDREQVNGLTVTDDGSVWVVAHEPDRLYQYDGEHWQKVGLPNDGGTTHVGREGTMWRTNPGPGGGMFNPVVDAMYRFDGTEWQRLDDFDEDALKALSGLDRRKVTPDGRLWVWPWLGGGRGVDLFVGSSRTNYLSGKVVMHADMAPDGTLWVLAQEEDGDSDLYVITPEAVAGVE